MPFKLGTTSQKQQNDINEILFIRNKEPKLNMQSDSVCPKPFYMTIEHLNTSGYFHAFPQKLILSINLLAFYISQLHGYATHYLLCDR